MASRTTLIVLAAAVAASAAAAMFLTPRGPVPPERLELRYPRMTAAQFARCDLDGDGLYDRGEQACLSGLYNQFHRHD